MNWLTDILSTSIGKKLMMAITGLCFCGFIVVHLVGNLTLYSGESLFTAYVNHLHAYDPIIKVAELILLSLAIVHISTGTILFLQNWKARPIRYAVKKNAGGRTIGSSTMPYTGFLILLFILLHLFDFHFADRTQRTLYQIVSEVFSSPAYSFIYITAVVIAAIHISHGLWSAFQTIGANHPKYMPFIRVAGIAFSVIVGIAFGFIPIFMAIA